MHSPKGIKNEGHPRYSKRRGCLIFAQSVRLEAGKTAKKSVARCKNNHDEFRLCFHSGFYATKREHL